MRSRGGDVEASGRGNGCERDLICHTRPHILQENIRSGNKLFDDGYALGSGGVQRNAFLPSVKVGEACAKHLAAVELHSTAGSTE